MLQGQVARLRLLCLGVVFLLFIIIYQSEAIPSSKLDNEVEGFFISPSLGKSEHQVSMVTSSGATATCTFNYRHKVSDKGSKTPEPKEKRLVPNQLYKEYQHDLPCLPYVLGFHSYEVCVGREIVQFVGQNKNEKVVIGQANAWNRDFLEQEYLNGTECAPSNQKRKATIFFLCGTSPTMVLKNVLEPQPCVYEFEIQLSLACGYPSQIRRIPAAVTTGKSTEPVETWFMEIKEVIGHGITCTVHSTGFGQNSPADSKLIDGFSIRLATDRDTAIPIKEYQVRYGLGESYSPSDLEVSKDMGTLRNANKLADSPNVISVTAASM